MRSTDELNRRKCLLQVRRHSPLPLGMQMYVQLINQDQARSLLEHSRQRIVFWAQVVWRQQESILCDCLDGEIGHQCKHHSLSSAQIVEWLRIIFDRKDNLFPVGIEPDGVCIRDTLQDCLANGFKSRAHFAAATPGRGSFSMK